MPAWPFHNTAGKRLVERAMDLDPDFSEWRDKPQAYDQKYGPAPTVIGRYLALKKQLLAEKKARGPDISPFERRRFEVAMSSVMSLAEHEFIEYVRSLGKRDCMRLRSSGQIVLVPTPDAK